MLFVVPPCFAHASRRMPHGVRPIKAILSRCHGRARRSLCRPEDGGRCAAPEPCSALPAYPIAPNRDSLKRSGTLTLSFIAFANIIRLQNSIYYFVLLVNGCFLRGRSEARTGLYGKSAGPCRIMAVRPGHAGAFLLVRRSGIRALMTDWQGEMHTPAQGSARRKGWGRQRRHDRGCAAPAHGNARRALGFSGRTFCMDSVRFRAIARCRVGRPARVSRSGGGARRCPQTPVRSRPPR